VEIQKGGKNVKKIWLGIVGAVLVVVTVGLVGCSQGDGLALGAENTVSSVILSNQQQGIWVSGEGKVTVVPDTAMLSLGIEAQEATVAVAQDKANIAMVAVMDALDAAGIDENDIQTRNFSIQPVSRWDNDKQQEYVVGYRVTNTVSVKVREIDNTGTVIDAVAAAGGDLIRVNSIGFTVDDPTPYYETAREDAVEDAAAKAEKLAETAGVELGKPTYITESSYVPTIYRDYAVGEASAPLPTVPTSISPGEMEVTVNVSIGYAIID